MRRARKYQGKRRTPIFSETDQTKDDNVLSQQSLDRETFEQVDDYCEHCGQRTNKVSGQAEVDKKRDTKVKESEALSRINMRTVNDIVAYESLTLLDENPIGFGGFGSVYRALHNDWGYQVAYKRLSVPYIGEINKADEQLIQKLKYEAEIHRQLRHPNIVSMLGVVFEANNYGIILEYLAYGSWINFLNRVQEVPDSSIPTILKTKLAFEISSGMSYLHSLKIIHCDLKVQNVLIGEDINAKISDFGLSKWKNFSRSNTNPSIISGTPSHIPPEQWKNDSFRPNDKSDVYSFAILLWEMFTEKQAYEDRQGMICDLVMSGKRLSLESLPQDVKTMKTSEIQAMIKACWSKHPEKRPNFSELTLKLRSLLNLPTNKQLINEAKTRVLFAYYKHSGPVVIYYHRQKINRVRQTLCDFMRRLDQILQYLLERGAVTSGEHEIILSQAAMFQKATQLLGVITVKQTSTYEQLLEAFDHTNQHHLRRLLEEKEFVLDVDHKTKLVDNFSYLKQNILISGSILDYLLKFEVLNYQEIDEIRSKNTEHERINQLLHLIMRTSPEQYRLFLESLKKSKHRHVYVKLTEQTKNDKRESRLNSRSFLDNPRLLGVIPGREYIRGITVLNSQLFVVLGVSTQVNVYDTNLKFIRHITISGLLGLHAVVSSPQFNCLYISGGMYFVYRYNLSDDVITQWSIGGQCCGLSLTSAHNVLVTLLVARQIEEYTPDGSLVRVISLDSSIVEPWHSVQLSTDQFVVCHGWKGESLHRVCIVDTRGCIIESYGGSRGSDVGQLNEPLHLAVDSHGNLLVADRGNNRVVLLSASLDYLSYITIPGHELSCPYTLHLDLATHCLYIGEDTGRVFVLTV